MKIKIAIPFILLASFVLVVGLACNLATPAEEAPVSKPTQATQNQESEPASLPSSASVSTLQDVQKAAIQIEAEGTFVDFEGAYASAGRGSGFIIDPSGLAVTNNHVVTGAALLKVWIGGDTGKSYNARVVAVSECSDLAVIDIDGDGFPYLEWYSEPIMVGLEVYSVGFPLGAPEYTLTRGIVSKENTDGETDWASVDAVIMHDATINPGNSGGPLVTADGKVVGVNYASYSSANQYFAIGREKALPIIDQLKVGTAVDSIGINGQAVVAGDGSVSGIWVSSVASGSPADRAGVQGGDLLLDLESHAVGAQGLMSDYCDIIRTHSNTDTMDVSVYRLNTDELLSGQINGTALAVAEANYTGSGGTAGGSSSGGSSAGTASGEYMAVTDDTGALYIEVPSYWTDINGEIWNDTWGNLSFTAADVIATPNFDNYSNSWGAPGVRFSASADWGNIGGYIQLLDATADWFVNCSKIGRYNYEDPVYEGSFDVWDCGVDADVIVISARPIQNKTAYLSLVQIQLGEDWGDSDDAVAIHISETFDIQSVLP